MSPRGELETTGYHKRSRPGVQICTPTDLIVAYTYSTHQCLSNEHKMSRLAQLEADLTP